MLSRYRSTIAALLVGALVLGVGTGCDILNVSNPNNLIEEDIKPTAAPSLANGAEAAVTRALGAIHAPYHTATGELTWIGSRDAWGQLDIGVVDNEFNEFTDAAFPYVGEATWVTQEYISQMKTFQENGDLESVRPLVRTYLYGAIIYTSTADIFDNYVLSDRREGGEPIGPSNMDTQYDQAITWLDEAISLANQSDDVASGSRLVTALYGMRARAKYSKMLWGKLHPDVTTGMSALVNNEGAVADAQTALDRMSGDFTYELELVSSAPGLVVGDLSMALQINERAELGFSPRYVETESDGTFESVTFTDVISGEVHPYLKSFINNFVSESQYADIPVVSQREMHLILAEAALAGNSGLSFETQINDLRALDNLPEYTGQADAFELLKQSREVNLFLQGRRLADHYRFASPSAQWTDSRDPSGTFLPITITEIRANPNLSQ
jgi:hypothetical protein